MPDTVRISNSDGNIPTDNMVGSLIKDSIENKVILLSSNPSGSVVDTEVSYTIDTNVASRHILCNLQSNTWYTIVIDGVSTSTIRSSENGILMFINSSIGSHDYTIAVPSAPGIPPAPPTNLKILSP